MATDSRVRKGKLVIDGVTYSCQPTAVSIEPENAGGEDESIEVLCGDLLTDSEGKTLEAVLKVTAVQDFTSATGSLIGFSWSNNLQEVDFTWQPTADLQDAWIGTIVMEAITVGGEVAKRLTTDAEWKITALVMPQKLGGQRVIGEPAAALEAE